MLCLVRKEISLKVEKKKDFCTCSSAPFQGQVDFFLPHGSRYVKISAKFEAVNFEHSWLKLRMWICTGDYKKEWSQTAKFCKDFAKYFLHGDQVLNEKNTIGSWSRRAKRPGNIAIFWRRIDAVNAVPGHGAPRQWCQQYEWTRFLVLDKWLM